MPSDRNWGCGLDELSRLPGGAPSDGSYCRNELLGRSAIGPNDAAGYDCCDLKFNSAIRIPGPATLERTRDAAHICSAEHALAPVYSGLAVFSYKRFIAVATLVALVGLNGGGILLAYSEAGLGEGESCGRSCCNLGKAGAVYASACCQLRCHEDTGESNSEPAREQILLEKADTRGVFLRTLSNPLLITHTCRLSLDRDNHFPDDGQPDLHVKHSVFLV